MQPRKANPALLGLFWLGIQVFWGALLAISLPARAAQLRPHGALTAYGTLATSGALVAAAVQIVVGVASDRRRALGSRRVEFYITGALAASCALPWFYTAPSFPQLLAAWMFVQAAMNVAIGPYQAVIPDFVADERMGFAASWMAGLQSLGNAAGAALAGLLNDLRLVATMISATLLATAAVTAAHVHTLTPLPIVAERLRTGRAFVDLFISRALVYVGFYTLLGYLYFYVALVIDRNARPIAGIVLLAFTLAGTLGALAAAAPSNRLDRRAVATLGGAVFALSLGVFLLSHQIVGLLMSACIAGAAWGVFLTADWALGCRFLPRRALATAMGIWNLALLIPQMIAPVIATAVISLLHALQSPSAPRIAFVAAACEVCAGIAWIWRLPAFSSSVESVQAGNTA